MYLIKLGFFIHGLAIAREIQGLRGANLWVLCFLVKGKDELCTVPYISAKNVYTECRE